MGYATIQDIIADLKGLGVRFGGPRPDFSGSRRPPAAVIDRWAEAAALAEPQARSVAIWAIREAALAAGIVPASVQELYIARAAEKWSERTVPAMNLRGWTYRTCRAVFRAAKATDAKLFIFEQAVGEWQYAQQPPAEYTAGVLAAALREGHEGPVFLQADHDQINAEAYKRDPKAETSRLEAIMREQIAAGYYSLDIDASTVVDLSLPNVREQQRLNAEITAHFTEFVRGIEPEGVTISLGAEIGEVGHENTTPEELREFMAVYREEIDKRGKDLVPVSKISINSGTYHGGKMQPDGVLAPVNVDYALLGEISDICRASFGMGGAVQHGASTLPGEQLAHFPKSGAIEIHLALGFNNLIFDHPALPAAMKQQIHDYTFANHAKERAAGENDTQFLYNTRKKSWKVMKQAFWEMPDAVQDEIMGALQTRFTDMFNWMNVVGTSKLVDEHTTPVKIAPEVPAALKEAAAA
jgi:fructose/tagatose bisphosphate aldolase